MGAKIEIARVLVLLLTLEIIFCLEPTPSNSRSRRKDNLSSRKNSKSGINPGYETDPGVLEMQSFLDITYPTSIFEVNEPYFYKSTYDDVLAPFPEDVQSSYKSLSSNLKKNVNKVPSTIYESKKDKITSNILSPLNDKEEPSYIQEDEYSMMQSAESKTSIPLNESNEVIQNNIIIPKETVFFDIVYRNGSSIENPIIELVPPSVPVRLKINIEICKDEEDCYNETMVPLGNETINIIEIEFVDYANNTVTDSEPISEDHITVLDEINDDDFVNALSILLLDSLNNKPIEVPLPDLLDIENSVIVNISLPDNIKGTNETNELITLWTLEIEDLPLSLLPSEEVFLDYELDTHNEVDYILDANFDEQSTNATSAEENIQLDKEPENFKNEKKP